MFPFDTGFFMDNFEKFIKNIKKCKTAMGQVIFAMKDEVFKSAAHETARPCS